VDLIVTSPPYWALRSYTDGGEHYDGQIGAEPTPTAYVDSLIECTREWMRVLKPDGSIWVNLGDCYYSGKGSPGKTTIDAKSEARTDRRARLNPLDGPSFGIGRKSLIGLPWRYAIRCVDDLGLILRAEVIWSKPNGLPESVTDRVRRSHETWFHFAKLPRYFSAVDTIREPASYDRHSLTRHARTDNRATAEARYARLTPNGQRQRCMADTSNPLGKLPGSVWEVPTQPLKVPAEVGVDHFAAFPMEWPRRIVQGWSPVGGTVLDPFGGTGTTALVAHALGRRGISVDMSADYCRLARWRTSDPGQCRCARGFEARTRD
jgi:site-specific DNA-methyltransferase (cytosine-N4-specific)